MAIVPFDTFCEDIFLPASNDVELFGDFPSVVLLAQGVGPWSAESRGMRSRNHIPTTNKAAIHHYFRPP